MTRTIDTKSFLGGICLGGAMGIVIGFLACLMQVDPDGDLFSTAQGDAGAVPSPLESHVDIGDHGAWIARFRLAAAATATASLVPILDRFATAISDGELSQSTLAELEVANRRLAVVVRELGDLGVAGTGANGPFTNPVTVVALTAATLERRGLPLTPDQLAHLAQIGRQFAAEDELRRKAYDEETDAFIRTADEGELKQRLYREIDGILTPEQRQALHGIRSRGRSGTDLFSAALYWSSFIAPVAAGERGTLARAITRRLVHTGSAALRDRVIPIVERWVSGLPPAFLRPRDDALSEHNLYPMDRIADAVRHQRVLHDMLIDAVGESARGLFEEPVLLMPQLR